MLEEEGHTRLMAPVPQFPQPISVDWPAARLALATGDEPMEPAKVESFKGSQQRLRREKSDRCWDQPKVVEPPGKPG